MTDPVKSRETTRTFKIITLEYVIMMGIKLVLNNTR
jgi:hypothetical protein